MRAAVFLDRDGTIIEDVPYLADPARVKLLPTSGAALRRLGDAGFLVVVVTNQSAIGRGLLTHDGLAAVHDEMQRQLADFGVELDGHYYCPVAPASDTAAGHPDRKPAPGMLLRAARELDIDLRRSWMVGDSLRDAQAGRNAGCRGTLLVRTGPVPPPRHDAVDAVVEDLAEAATHILAATPSNE